MRSLEVGMIAQILISTLPSTIGPVVLETTCLIKRHRRQTDIQTETRDYFFYFRVHETLRMHESGQSSYGLDYYSENVSK